MAIYNKKLYIRNKSNVIEPITLYTTLGDCDNKAITIIDETNNRQKVYAAITKTKLFFCSSLFVRKNDGVYYVMKIAIPDSKEIARASYPTMHVERNSFWYGACWKGTVNIPYPGYYDTTIIIDDLTEDFYDNGLGYAQVYTDEGGGTHTEPDQNHGRYPDISSGKMHNQENSFFAMAILKPGVTMPAGRFIPTDKAWRDKNMIFLNEGKGVATAKNLTRTQSVYIDTPLGTCNIYFLLSGNDGFNWSRNGIWARGARSIINFRSH